MNNKKPNKHNSDNHKTKQQTQTHISIYS